MGEIASATPEHLRPVFDDVVLDLSRGCLMRAGQPIHLRPQSYAVLAYLVEQRGRLVSKDQLIEKVWEGRAVTDGSVGKCIEEVRATLGGDARSCLRTVRGRGYIFDPAPDVKMDEPAVSPAVQVPDDGLENAAIGPRHQRIVIPLAAAALAAVLFIGFIGAPYVGRRSPAIPSIAVLPFANSGGHTDIQYLSDGLAENLIDRLSKLSEVKVIAASSSFQYRASAIDSQEVGRTLGVDAIVTGQLVERGDTVHVSIELVKASDRTHLWRGAYTRTRADLQDLPAEAALTIAKELGVPATRTERPQATGSAAENSLAYQHYLNGLFHRRKGDRESVTKALEYFQEAVRRNPDFAAAWAMSAEAHLFFAGNSLSEPRERLDTAKRAAQKALALDQTVAEGHLALGLIDQSDWDWAAADRAYERALVLNPNLVSGLIRQSRLHSNLGRHDAALDAVRRARHLDPLSVGLRFTEAFTYSLAGRHDEAIDLYKQSMAVDSSEDRRYVGLGLAFSNAGRYEEAVAAYRSAIRSQDETTSVLCYLGYALARLGQRSEAERILRQLTTTTEYVSPFELAAVYAGLDDKEGALKLLQKGYDQHDLQMQYLNLDRQLDGLRSDSRFVDLVRRVGLPRRDEASGG